MTDLVWRTPPRDRKPPNSPISRDLALKADILRSDPGRWGIVRSYPVERWGTARQMAVNIKQGKYLAFRPDGHFDARSAREGDKVHVYAMYTAGKRTVT